MQKLTLKESPFPTAKRMEYYYRICEGTHILCAWHSERKMTRLEKPFVKHDKHGYLRTSDKDEAVGEVTKILWSDGSESFVDKDGVLRDTDETESSQETL